MTRTAPFLTAFLCILVVGCPQRHNAVKTSKKSDPWVIRTDFSSDEKWAAVREAVSAPQKDAITGSKFYAYVRFVNDKKYREKTPQEVVVSLPDDYPGMFCFVVDRKCIESEEHPLLVVSFYPSDNKSFHRRPRETPAGDITTFRALPSKVQEIENNLSIANMDFEDFAKSVDADGIYRGLPPRAQK